MLQRMKKNREIIKAADFQTGRGQRSHEPVFGNTAADGITHFIRTVRINELPLYSSILYSSILL